MDCPLWLRKWLRVPPPPPDELREWVEKLTANVRTTYHAHGIVCAAVKNPNGHRLRAAIPAMQTLCRGHDNTRAILARIERLVGVECPQYDCGPIDGPLQCVRTGTCRKT